jgi:CRISPR/Cas system endoribonuclease Cas6 (RAMP superfamily)
VSSHVAMREAMQIYDLHSTIDATARCASAAAEVTFKSYFKARTQSKAIRRSGCDDYNRPAG